MDTKHQLGLLLRIAGDEASCQCLTALDEETRSYHAGRSVPVSQMRSIYSIRAQINARNGGMIAGFDGLIAGLNACQEPSVTIHSIGTPPAELFLVFTDAAMTQIVGILHIPAKASAGEIHTSAELAAA